MPYRVKALVVHEFEVEVETPEEVQQALKRWGALPLDDVTLGYSSYIRQTTPAHVSSSAEWIEPA